MAAPPDFDFSPIATIIVAAVTAVGGYFVSRAWKPGQRELQLVTALQGDVAALRAEVAELRAAQAVTDQRLQRVTAHAWKLHAQLIENAVTPHPWPADLLNGDN